MTFPHQFALRANVENILVRKINFVLLSEKNKV